MRERAQNFDPRQHMAAQTFEVFHYKEPRPADVEVHHHDFYEVYHLLEGHVDYWVEGRILSMEPGDLLLINPMELHRPIIDHEKQTYERIVLWINREYLQSLSPALCACFESSDHVHLIHQGASKVTVHLRDLVREYYSGETCSAFAAQGIFLQFMSQLNRLAAKSSSQEGRALSRLVQTALQYITENIAGELSLEAIAGACYVSKYYLSHAFTKEVGVSVYRYILLRRLLLARQLLATGESASTVCRSCGFTDYTSFYRAFRSEYGISPKNAK